SVLYCLRHVKFSDATVTPERVTATVRSTRRTSRCPCCGVRSSSVHSYYCRHVSGLPIHGKKVDLTAIVRRFRCSNAGCSRSAFSEQIDGLTERYSRRSIAVRSHLERFLVHVPATVGAHQSSLCGIQVSASTALRIVYGIMPVIDYGSIRRICIDDFAFRKGRTYRTLVVDADTGLPVEIIGSRDEPDVSEALKKYINVGVVSRDRSSSYAKAVRDAIPGAHHVADRFHLVRNCGEYIEKALRHSQQAIRQEVVKHTQTPAASQAASLYRPPTLEDIELFNKVKGLRAKGRSLKGIAAELGISWVRVTDICNSEAPHGKKVTTPKMILPYLDIIGNGIVEGKGYRDIQADIISSGGKISTRALSLGMKKMYPQYRPRRGGWGARERNLADAKANARDEAMMLGSGRLHIYLTAPDYGVDKKTGACSRGRVLAEKLISSSATLLQLRECHMSFRTILKEGPAEALDEWIKRYSGTPYKDVASFVDSVKNDINPIRNAIRHPISNGLIEGLNNKIKAMKRSMYGRASD
ncbi:MAG: ISL3 family transposase, partial [Bacteroidales bacterium]|nr:ISL3 family transposase [Bacteroidales bacterium]